MATLSDLQRRIIQQLPAWISQQQADPMQGDVAGHAQMRLGHGDAYILPENQYNTARQQFGQGGEQAITISAQPNILDHVMNLLGMQASPLMRSALRGPTVVAPQKAADFTANPEATATMRHEAIHALLHGADTKPNVMAVQDLIPAEALVSLSRFYNPQEIAQELPARATTQPESLQMYPEEGRVAMQKYLQMLEQSGSKQQADKLRQYLNLDGKPQGQTRDQSFQKPNDVF